MKLYEIWNFCRNTSQNVNFLSPLWGWWDDFWAARTCRPLPPPPPPPLISPRSKHNKSQLFQPEHVIHNRTSAILFTFGMFVMRIFRSSLLVGLPRNLSAFLAADAYVHEVLKMHGQILIRIFTLYTLSSVKKTPFVQHLIFWPVLCMNAIALNIDKLYPDRQW